MKLTTTQVAEKFGVTHTTIGTWVRAGKLKDVSGKKGRHEYLIDSKEVNAINPKNIRRRLNHTEPKGPVGIINKLNSIESKLDVIIKMWN